MKLHAPGALVVYPELHLGESAPGIPAAPEEVAEPLDGKRDAAFAELAGDLGTWLVPGSVYERGTGDRVHKTTPVHSPQGERLAAYRKICPWRPYETTTPGNRFEVIDLAGVGRIGLPICYDTWFPEISRHLAWMGAELIVNVVRTSMSDRAQEVVLNRANAITNQVFVASVNSAAPSGMGRSLVIDAAGARKQSDLRKEPPGGVFTEPGDHGLGRSRGGFTTKLHLVVEQGQKPMSIVVTAGQRGDSPKFESVLEKVRVPRIGPGRPRVRPNRSARTRRTPPAGTAPTCAAAESAALSRTRPTRRVTAGSSAPAAAGRRSSTR